MQAAAGYSGYNVQYLRRLVSAGAIAGVKVGPVWLVQVASLDAYLQRVQRTADRRFGPRLYQEYVNRAED
jgi:hypothetical protein